MTHFFKSCFVAALTLAAVGASQAAVVYSNASPLGDNHMGSGAKTIVNDSSATGWRYNNATNGGSVSIDTTFARSGDGSVRLQTTQNTSRSDIAYYATNAAGSNANVNFLGTSTGGGATVFTGSLGAFSSLTNFGYDWYRASGPTTGAARANYQPAFRIYLDTNGSLGTVGDRLELIFEPAAFGSGARPVNQWVTETLGLTTRLYNNNRTGAGVTESYNRTLSDWQSLFGNASILGFGVTVGSGWGGSMLAATDNISWTIGGLTTTTNFEVTPRADVPEPGSLALVALALAGLGVVKRRNRKAR